MKTYHINFFKAVGDTVVDQSDDLTWPEMVELFSIHQPTATKNCMMFNTCTFKTTDYQPAERNIYVNGVATGRALHLKDGNTQVGRFESNVISYSCLVFDFDGNGNTLESVFQRFDGITHIGYTSYNHFIKGVDKCRIIVPLDDDIPKDELRRRKKSILDFAETDDESTLAVSRAFYMPSHPLGEEKHAFAWHVNGLMLDWEIFEPVKEIEQPVVWHPPVKLLNNATGKIHYETFDIVQFMKDRGLYHRKVSAGKHDVKCPNAAAHSGVAGGTVVYEGSNGVWPNFYCAHSHCRDFDFFGYWKLHLGKGWMNGYCLREDTLSKIIF